MYKRKAFLHWYQGEGMDEMEFTEGSSWSTAHGRLLILLSCAAESNSLDLMCVVMPTIHAFVLTFASSFFSAEYQQVYYDTAGECSYADPLSIQYQESTADDEDDYPEEQYEQTDDAASAALSQ
jgi:hypothetical protein